MQAQEQAAGWLARIDKGLSPADEIELRRWLREHAQHREVFLELAALWDEADRLSELAALFPLERMAERHDGVVWAQGWRYVAAAAAVLVSAAVLLMLRAPERVEDVEEVVYAAEYSTQVGGQAVEHLPDESVLRLNTYTDVDVEYTPAGRTVFLHRGEAYFEVASDPNRRFRVRVGDRIVEAVGTAFNVRLDPGGEVHVTVTSGRVRVTRSETRAVGQQAALRAPNATTLVEGDVAVVDRSSGETEVRRLQPADIDIQLAWRRGALIFRGEPLDTMLKEAGRYTMAEFVLADEELADIRVGGYFRVGDIDSLLAVLRENFGIEAERMGEDRIILRATR
jgi:transmembrane sensor